MKKLDIPPILFTLLSLVWMEFRKRYLGTIFGVIWTLINPLVTIVLIYLVFRFGFKTQSIGDIPYINWLIPGMLAWFFVSESLVNGCLAVMDYPFLVTKIKFPIHILPIVKILSGVPVHLFLVIIFLFILVIEGNCNIYFWPQIIYYFICACLLCLGLSYMTSACMVFIRDVSNIVGVIVQFLFWATPIFWNPEIVKGTIGYVLIYSPFAYIIMGYRDSILYGVPFWDKPYVSIFFWICTLSFLIGGYSLFQRTKSHFSDVI